MATVISGTNGISTAGIVSSGDISLTGSSELIFPNLTTQTTTGTKIRATTVALSGTNVVVPVPSGVVRIKAVVLAMSGSGTSAHIYQLGYGAGLYETTTYLTGVDANSTAASPTITNAITSGFPITNGPVAANFQSITTNFTLIAPDTNTWMVDSLGGAINSGVLYASWGARGVTSELNNLKLTTVNGTDTFDSGSLCVQFEY